jgi:hypothetical protein
VAGANKPDGKSNTQRVSFTRRDADRIGRVVRTVEAGDKKGNALTFGYRQPPPRDTFRMDTFRTGSILLVDGQLDSTAVVTFSRQPVSRRRLRPRRTILRYCWWRRWRAKGREQRLASHLMGDAGSLHHEDHRHRVGPKYSKLRNLSHARDSGAEVLAAYVPFRYLLHGNNARVIYGTMRLLRMYYRRRLLRRWLLLQRW